MSPPSWTNAVPLHLFGVGRAFPLIILFETFLQDGIPLCGELLGSTLECLHEVSFLLLHACLHFLCTVAQAPGVCQRVHIYGNLCGWVNVRRLAIDPE